MTDRQRRAKDAPRLTLEQARALADQWKAQRDDQDRAPTAAYFHGTSTHDLIKMWESGKGADGKRLTKREFGCLVERWFEVFGDFPPSKEDGTADDGPAPKATVPMPADDTMLRMPDVVRITGLSKSSIKRLVEKGALPKPMRIGIRAKGWPARDIRQFIDTLDEQRRRPR